MYTLTHTHTCLYIQMQAAGMDSTLGKDGKEFFKTLRQILVAK